MGSVGSFLKAARQQQKKTVEQVSAELCISATYVKGIEADDIASLPGAFFYRSFAKQYATVLNVNLDAAALDLMAAPPEKAPRLEPAPILRPAEISSKPVYQPDAIILAHNQLLTDRHIGMSAAALVVVLLLCSAFYAWWTRPTNPAAAIASIPQASPALVRQETIAVPSAATSDSATLTPVAVQALSRADLEISATEQVWISITSNGNVIFSGVLEPSQTKSLTGIDGAQIKLGNAGGVEVRWKGKDVGPVGPRGQVRTVVLKPDNVEIIQPQPEFSEL